MAPKFEHQQPYCDSPTRGHPRQVRPIWSISACVGQVLKNEEERKNYQFVSRDTRVDDIRASFAAQTLLEAVLVTTSGEEAEKLLGIATRWDMLQLA